MFTSHLTILSHLFVCPFPSLMTAFPVSFTSPNRSRCRSLLLAFPFKPINRQVSRSSNQLPVRSSAAPLACSSIASCPLFSLPAHVHLWPVLALTDTRLLQALSLSLAAPLATWNFPAALCRRSFGDLLLPATLIPLWLHKTPFLFQNSHMLPL